MSAPESTPSVTLTPLPLEISQGAVKSGHRSTPSTPRIDAIDMVKGVLVVFMVAYHSLNYSTRYQLAFQYMAFLPPSFILITGFLLSHVYSARKGLPFSQLCMRLL